MLSEHLGGRPVSALGWQSFSQGQRQIWKPHSGTRSLLCKYRLVLSRLPALSRLLWPIRGSVDRWEFSPTGFPSWSSLTAAWVLYLFLLAGVWEKSRACRFCPSAAVTNKTQRNDKRCSCFFRFISLLCSYSIPSLFLSLPLSVALPLWTCVRVLTGLCFAGCLMRMRWQDSVQSCELGHWRSWISRRHLWA